MLKTLNAGGGKAVLEDLESLVFAPWMAEYERREESGEEASWSPYLARLRSQAGGRSADLDLLAAWFRPYGEQLVPTTGAREALEALRQMELKLALVSNVPLPGSLYAAVLARHGLADPFDRMYFSYDCESRKPSPAMLRLAMSDLDVAASACVMVGDRRERDIAAGRLAGTGTIWIRSTDAGGPAADATIDGLADLPGLLTSWQR
jgi:HAD superfamily hydrolase (TIGR01662 family)